MMHDDIATPAPERSPRIWMRAAWFILAAVAGLICWSYAEVELIDDAFISLRYADNLLAGHGLVFNPGERVEGYSNFLWVLLLAAAGGLGLEMPAASQWLGGLFGVGLVWATATALPGHRPWRLLAPALLVGNLTVWLWAVHGLETVMFACWVTLGIRSDLRGWREGRVPLGSALWYALAALTRPEGPYFFVASTAYWAVLHPRALVGRRSLVSGCLVHVRAFPRTDFLRPAAGSLSGILSGASSAALGGSMSTEATTGAATAGDTSPINIAGVLGPFSTDIGFALRSSTWCVPLTMLASWEKAMTVRPPPARRFRVA
ncbi:MAG: hypothetical protein QGH45_12050 [Myxococcota bacterium]|nr:hypothetical protein [Myxococcota bacterium]